MAVMSIGQLEQLALQQNAELQNEESMFSSRLKKLTMLRNHIFVYQQRDKVEQLQNIHDKLLQQEYSLRKLRRIRSEVDAQRSKNDKLVRDLAKMKEELIEKEQKVQVVKKTQSAVQNGDKKPMKPIADQVVNGATKKLLAPAKLQPNSNGHAVFHENGNNDDTEGSEEEIATSFITGWAPASKQISRPNFNRYSAPDVHQNGVEEDTDETIMSSASENVRPASDFMGHGTLPTYRYVPRTHMFKQRIGVDGGRAKTVESLYKDFHPRALHQTAAVSIFEDEQQQQQQQQANGIAVLSSTSVSISTTQNSSPKSSVKSILSKCPGEKVNTTRRVRFSPIALLLDAALDGDLELVKVLLVEMEDPSAPNDEGITALHNAICAGHCEMVELLVKTGCDVNSSDCDGWTGLHCAASCNNRQLCQLLVENGASLFALTSPDNETPRDKCEPDEEGFTECYTYLLECEEKLGRADNCAVYGAFELKSRPDEDSFDSDLLQFGVGATLKVLRRGDDGESNWWWAQMKSPGRGDPKDWVGKEGYVPTSYLALYQRNQHWIKRYGKISS